MIDNDERPRFIGGYSYLVLRTLYWFLFAQQRPTLFREHTELRQPQMQASQIAEIFKIDTNKIFGSYDSLLAKHFLYHILQVNDFTWR